jgi:hypothetical protein
LLSRRLSFLKRQYDTKGDKMSRCPKCDELICRLEYTCDRTESGYMEVDGEMNGNNDGDGDCYHWYCSECHEELFDDANLAVDFLRDKRLVIETYDD